MMILAIPASLWGYFAVFFKFLDGKVRSTLINFSANCKVLNLFDRKNTMNLKQYMPFHDCKKEIFRKLSSKLLCLIQYDEKVRLRWQKSTTCSYD